MTTDELRAAAETVVATGMHKDWADTIDAGAVAVCKAWLKENPADRTQGDPVTTRTVYYADDRTYTVSEAERMSDEGRWAVQWLIRVNDSPLLAWTHQLRPTRAAAVATLIAVANSRIAAGQEAHRALATLKRDPDAPREPEPRCAGDVDREFAAVGPVVTDDDDEGPDEDATPLEHEHGEPVATIARRPPLDHLERPGIADRRVEHGERA